MKTLTLCESVFRAQSQPFNSKPLNSRSSSPSLRLLRKESKQSSRNWRFCLSRYSRLLSQYVKKDKELLGCFAKSVSASMHAIVSVHDDNDKETSKSISINHDFSHLDNLPAEISTMDELSTFGNQDAVPVSEPYHEVLKLGLLFGLFTFQGPQQAMASSDFASGILSIPFIGDLGDISTGFASAFLLIFFSELGDKTFFIAALLAARNSGLVVFIGTFGALAAMTIVSVILGRTFHYVDELLPFRFAGADLPIDDIAAVCLLVYFGVSTLLDASSSDSLKAAEEQKEAELAVSDFSGNGAGILSAANTVISTFALVFVAEWGDKSFFSTIALAAASSPLGVVGGALAGHAVATLLAVVGGSLLGTFFSEKIIAYVGGVLFLVFAVVTLIEIFN